MIDLANPDEIGIAESSQLATSAKEQFA